MRHVLGSALLFLFVSGTAFGAPKGDLINRGKDLFSDQQYEESIQVLSGALVRPDNTEDERLEILRYLSYDYIILNRKDEADAALRAIFAVRPDFELEASASPRFRDFFAKAKDKWVAEGRPGYVPKIVNPDNPEAPTATISVSMAHTSPAQVEIRKNLELVARLSDPKKEVRQVKLLYRNSDKGKFSELFAQLNDGMARVTIPGEEVKPPILEYYFVALNGGKLAVASRGDAGSPFRIAVAEPSSKGWVVPVVIGASVLAAGAVVGGLWLAGVFDKKNEAPPTSTLTIRIN